MDAYRSEILHFSARPDMSSQSGVEHYRDGILLVEDGIIQQCAEAEAVLPQLPEGLRIHHWPDKLIMPGMIDTHVHFPQLDVIASYGEQLLDWLNNYTYKAEARFADSEYARTVAELFIAELFRNGTTSAQVFCTVHSHSVDAFFEQSARHNARMLAGKVMMDRNAPQELLDTAKQSYEEVGQLIDKWHKKGRALYALAPRFAPTSTPEQMLLTSKLKREYGDVYMQTHLSENREEVAWVKSLFPQCSSYLDVYDNFGLLGERSVFAHGIHLSDQELQRLSQSGSSVAFCPTSNLFLGSGLLDLGRLENHGVNYSVATDVGAGTSFSMMQTLAESYKVAQLGTYQFSPLEAFYRVTLGNARSLQLDHLVGNFEAGKEADFIVLDQGATPLLSYRLAQCQTLVERLFAMMILGDDRMIDQTYIAGVCRHSKTAEH